MKIKKGTFFLLAALLISVAVFLFADLDDQRPTMGAARYNVLLIVSDALRSGALGCYGGEARTPNIDWIAGEGALFEHAYSTAPWTSPSAVSMFTGHHSGAYQRAEIPIKGRSATRIEYTVPDEELLLSEALEQLDYKLRMDVENPYASLHNNLQGFKKLRKIKQIPKDRKLRTETITGIREADGTRYKDLYSLLDFLIHPPEDQSFFALKWFSDPHAPHDPPERFKKEIGMDPSLLPEEEAYYSTVLNADRCPEALGRPLSDMEVAYLRALYLKEVESLDERVGFLLSALRHSRLLDTTFILFTSDHGEQFGVHGLFCHSNSYYQELVHVPLLIAGPGIARGQRIEAPVSHLDLMPTVKDLLGVEYPSRAAGRSYGALLFGGERGAGTCYFDGAKSECAFEDALLEDGYKLIMRKEGSPGLFDLSRDPGELQDLSAVDRDRARKMGEILLRIRAFNSRLKKEHSKKQTAPVPRSKEEEEETMKKLKDLGYVS